MPYVVLEKIDDPLPRGEDIDRFKEDEVDDDFGEKEMLLTTLKCLFNCSYLF
jgi:hypothetical protein